MAGVVNYFRDCAWKFAGTTICVREPTASAVFGGSIEDPELKGGRMRPMLPAWQIDTITTLNQSHAPANTRAKKMQILK